MALEKADDREMRSEGTLSQSLKLNPIPIEADKPLLPCSKR